MGYLSQSTIDFLAERTCRILDFDREAGYDYNSARMDELSKSNQVVETLHEEILGRIFGTCESDPDVVQHCLDYRNMMIHHSSYFFKVLFPVMGILYDKEHAQVLQYVRDNLSNTNARILYLAHYQAKHNQSPRFVDEEHHDKQYECLEFYEYTLPVIQKINEFYFNLVEV